MMRLALGPDWEGLQFVCAWEMSLVWGSYDLNFKHFRSGLLGWVTTYLWLVFLPALTPIDLISVIGIAHHVLDMVFQLGSIYLFGIFLTIF
jgi:hypothetical protein